MSREERLEKRRIAAKKSYAKKKGAATEASSTSSTSSSKPPPPSLDGEVGAERLAQAVGQAESGLSSAAEKEARTKKAAVTGKKSATLSKAEKEAFELDFEICHSLVQMPSALGGEMARSFAPEQLREDLANIWKESPEMSRLAGKALHVLALRHGEDWIEHAPAIILAVTLGGGLLLRSAMTWRMINAYRARTEVEPAGPSKQETPEDPLFDGPHPAA